MFRILSLALSLLVVGCTDQDSIALKVAVANTEKGEYRLIVVSELDPKFVSFQKSADHKKQYYYQDDERDTVFEAVAEAVEKARKKGYEIDTMGLHEYLKE